MADIHPLKAPNWYGTTPVGSTRFVGRLAEMWEVHSLLHRGDVTQITGAAVATGGIGQVSGLGGVGKSLLAEEYALHFGAAYPGGVFWLRAYGNDDAKSALGPEGREAERAGQMQSIVERLGVSTQGMTQPQIEGAVGREIERRGKSCLWIVDDMPNRLDGKALRRWFAPHPLARTLITTRSREYGSLAKGVDLSVLAPDEAYQLLTSRRQPGGPAEDEQAHLLAEDLGRHALALDVTASALQNSVAAQPFADFRARLARPDKDAMELAAELSDALPNRSEKSIAQTLVRSIRSLGAEGMDFLRLASMLAVAPIPVSLVTEVFGRADNLSHHDAEERASRGIKQVTAASLAEKAGEQQEARALHTLVSRTMRFHEKGTPDRTEALRAAAVAALCNAIAEAADDPRMHKQIELHVAHAREVVLAPATVDEANLASWVATYHRVRGAYTSAQALYELELEFRRRVQGAEHSDTLTSMSNLALTLDAHGDLAGARKLNEETLAVRRQVLGPEHLDTLNSMHNLATTYWSLGDLAAARKFQEEILAIRRRVMGPEHPDTLTSMNDLASTLDSQGDFAGARKLKEQALGTRRRVLGPEHPDTLISMDNLASSLYLQGDLAGARELQEEVLNTFRRVLGPEHPNTLTSMNNLSVTLDSIGDLATERELQEQTLAIRRRVLGPEHPDTLTSMDNLAGTLYLQGDLAGALKLYEETLATRRQVLGPEHPLALESMNNLACTLKAQGDTVGARKLLEETLAIQSRVLGPEHPHTSKSTWNICRTLQELSEHTEVQIVLERDLLWLLDRDPATLGADQRQIREYVAEVIRRK